MSPLSGANQAYWIVLLYLEIPAHGKEVEPGAKHQPATNKYAEEEWEVCKVVHKEVYSAKLLCRVFNKIRKWVEQKERKQACNQALDRSLDHKGSSHKATCRSHQAHHMDLVA